MTDAVKTAKLFPCVIQHPGNRMVFTEHISARITEVAAVSFMGVFSGKIRRKGKWGFGTPFLSLQQEMGLYHFSPGEAHINLILL